MSSDDAETLVTRAGSTIKEWLDLRFYHRGVLQVAPTVCEVPVLPKSRRKATAVDEGGKTTKRDQVEGIGYLVRTALIAVCMCTISSIAYDSVEQERRGLVIGEFRRLAVNIAFPGWYLSLWSMLDVLIVLWEPHAWWMMAAHVALLLVTVTKVGARRFRLRQLLVFAAATLGTRLIYCSIKLCGGIMNQSTPLMNPGRFSAWDGIVGFANKSALVVAPVELAAAQQAATNRTASLATAASAMLVLLMQVSCC